MPISTPHIIAEKEDFARTVLMPGDPRRSEFIARTFLDDPRLVNDIRGVKGFTGSYKGKKVSVMASGMGMPSIGIYSWELFTAFGVENIIRIGTAGSYDKELHLGDLIIAQGACTNSNYASMFGMPGIFAPIADFGLLRQAAEICDRRGFRYKVGNIYSSDTFYSDSETDLKWAELGVLGVDMEAAALYANAAKLGGKALCICSVSNSFIYPEEDASASERETMFTNMMEVALELA
ncbi:MAG: purine-nucleoside phosphorylase [Firmicutes bacterium]|nr:purine-nucleoside phosphorylase [Bacillota bacterium]